VVSLAAALLLGCPLAASAQKAGYDLLETQPGATVDLSKVPGFQPATIPLKGVPICSCIGNADTIMYRTQDMPSGGGKVPLSMVALFMKSSGPVLFNGKPVDLYVTVNRTNGVIGQDVLPQPDPLPPSNGGLTVRTNGTFDSELHVAADVIVVPAGASVTNPANHLSHRRGPDVTLVSAGSTWTSTPPAGYPSGCVFPANGFYPGAIQERGPHPVAPAKGEGGAGTGGRPKGLEYLRRDAASFSTFGTGGNAWKLTQGNDWKVTHPSGFLFFPKSVYDSSPSGVWEVCERARVGGGGRV
jgi:hypothetical protein